MIDVRRGWMGGFLLAASCLLSTSPSWGAEAAKRGFFVSIDSLRGDHVKILTEAGVLTGDHGIGWLYRTGSRADRALPVEITLTAPSHVSTITCSSPHAHGIIANSFMTGGQKVNGFTYDIKSETFWEAAKRQGKKVLAVAYVGADGKSDRRRADVGISYPSDGLLGKAQTLKWDLSTLAIAQGWNIGAVPIQAALREVKATLVINGQTAEQREVNVLFVQNGADSEAFFDDDKDLSNGHFGSFNLAGPRLQVLDGLFVEANVVSPIVGFKKRIRFTLLESQNGQVSVYASTATYNNAYPEDFRKSLDAKNLVWVDPYIPSATASLTAGEYVKTTVALDGFLADVAIHAQSQQAFDVVLFYQPRLDEFSHKFAGSLSVPLNPSGANEIEVAFVAAFKELDQNVSRVLGEFDTGRDVVALMGDHGMEPIKKQVNVGPFIREIDPAASIVISGALVLVYPTTGDVDQRVGENVDRRLAALSFEGNPLNGRTHRRDQTPADKWQYGEATWAFTSGKTLWFTNSLVGDIFIAPPITGMHGHDSDAVPNMATIFMLRAPGVGRQVLPEMSLLDAVPTFAQHMGMSLPANCEGHAALSAR